MDYDNIDAMGPAGSINSNCIGNGQLGKPAGLMEVNLMAKKSFQHLM
jgi:hypothetical protein